MPARNTKRMNTFGGSYAVLGTSNVEDDRTGFKVKGTECQFEWNNLFVRKKSWEQRQPQDFLRAFADFQAPKVSRPGTGDQFLSSTDVKASDL